MSSHTAEKQNRSDLQTEESKTFKKKEVSSSTEATLAHRRMPKDPLLPRKDHSLEFAPNADRPVEDMDVSSTTKPSVSPSDERVAMDVPSSADKQDYIECSSTLPDISDVNETTPQTSSISLSVGKETFKRGPHVHGNSSVPSQQLTHFLLVTEWEHRTITQGTILGWKEGLKLWERVTTVPLEFCGAGAACLYQGCIAMTSSKSSELKIFDLTKGKWLPSQDVGESLSFSAMTEVDGLLMRFGGNKAEVLNQIPGSLEQKSSKLDITFASVSLAAEGAKVIIVGRNNETIFKTNDNLHVMLFDQKTGKAVSASFSPLTHIDMSRYMSAPKYVGVVRGAHGFLLNDGCLLRFRIEEDQVKECESLAVPEMDRSMRRQFGTFLEKDEITIIGGKTDEQNLFIRDAYTTDFSQIRRACYPLLQYDTNILNTFQL